MRTQAVGCGVCATRWSSGVAPRACVRVYARGVLVHGFCRIFFDIPIYTYNMNI